ncbi:MAG: ABC transporter permease subunit, partial [Peptostreptococcales bacterium]
YFAALTSIDPELYQAAIIDGAGRLRQVIHISIPGILPTIVILLILNLGSMMSVGFQKIILLYNPSIYETADVISTFVYRKGLLELSYSFSAAVGLFNTVINFTLLIISNYVSRKVNETSLW